MSGFRWYQRPEGKGLWVVQLPTGTDNNGNVTCNFLSTNDLLGLKFIKYWKGDITGR